MQVPELEQLLNASFWLGAAIPESWGSAQSLELSCNVLLDLIQSSLKGETTSQCWAAGGMMDPRGSLGI